MPSVNDVQQKSSNNSGKSTPPPSQQQQIDSANLDPLSQAILVLEKKQRNLGKRKEKLEGYEQEAKSGKDLNKDQKDALAKYPEVLGQIECVKELSEQFKKIQTESSKNQKRLSKQIAEEKRLQASQRLREYAQLRYLLDHRPTSLKAEESSLLDELSRIIIPSDNSLNTISHAVDIVLTIYQGGSLSSTIKSRIGKTPQEIKEILEHLLQNENTQISTQQEITTNIDSSNKYSVEFDTTNENTQIEQICEDKHFFPIDNKTEVSEDNNIDPSSNTNQYLSTFNIINSNINDQPSSSSISEQQTSSNLIDSNNLSTDEQQTEEQWQHHRSTANTHRSGQYNNEGGNRNSNRAGYNNYNQSQWRGPRGGRYDGGQRQYHENTRGRGGSNPNYRGNRGGNYRGGNRGNTGYYGNGNEYQTSSHYQQNNEQQIRSAPPTQQ